MGFNRNSRPAHQHAVKATITEKPALHIARRTLVRVAAAAMLLPSGVAAQLVADLSGYDPRSGVSVSQADGRLRLEWPIGEGERGAMSLRMDEEGPLIEQFAVAPEGGPFTPVLRDVNPVLVLTVGKRDLAKRDGWTIFFDRPGDRSFEHFAAKLEKRAVRVTSEGRRATVVIDGLTAGPFAGDLRFTFYPGGRIIRAEAVMSSEQDSLAILYDAGLSSPAPSWDSIRWLDSGDDEWRHAAEAGREAAASEAVRHRAIVAVSRGGSLALFPPPHQYLYPIDLADNYGFVWHGRGWQSLVSDAAFGVRQPRDALSPWTPWIRGRWAPWVNAPPGSEQRLGLFYLLGRGDAAETLESVRRYTRSDRYERLDGYRTMASHFHIEHVLGLGPGEAARDRSSEPPFVRPFKDLGVDIVHLAEFHVNHTPEISARRLPLLRELHEETERLSDDEILFLPGEEPNVHLGGHWISLFPRPVYWTLGRDAGQPFSERVDGYGTVYHVGSAADVQRLMEEEQGLMWTAHPRLKSSTGFPDDYRDEPFFLSDRFLGATWKAMPADYSDPRLGTRVLDLLSDMANWGLRKQALGEVDIFSARPEFELYGHMNVNYVEIDELPRFSDGWSPVVDALRAGRFFTTTGEVLIPAFTLGGTRSGETLAAPGGLVELQARLRWTFPLAFAEVVSGDGERIFRQRIDLADTEAFGVRDLVVPIELRGRSWARLEVWDVASNGAFTQPVWIER
jgi:hypothetical protein